MDKQEAAEYIKSAAPEGSTIYAIVRATNRANISRTISFYSIQNNNPIPLDNAIATLLELPIKSLGRTDEGVYVEGAGMDMGFYLVNRLAKVLYNDETALYHAWL